MNSDDPSHYSKNGTGGYDAAGPATGRFTSTLEHEFTALGAAREAGTARTPSWDAPDTHHPFVNTFLLGAGGIMGGMIGAGAFALLAQVSKTAAAASMRGRAYVPAAVVAAVVGACTAWHFLKVRVPEPPASSIPPAPPAGTTRTVPTVSGGERPDKSVLVGTIGESEVWTGGQVGALDGYPTVAAAAAAMPPGTTSALVVAEGDRFVLRSIRLGKETVEGGPPTDVAATMDEDAQLQASLGAIGMHGTSDLHLMPSLQAFAFASMGSTAAVVAIERPTGSSGPAGLRVPTSVEREAGATGAAARSAAAIADTSPMIARFLQSSASYHPKIGIHLDDEVGPATGYATFEEAARDAGTRAGDQAVIERSGRFHVHRTHDDAMFSGASFAGIAAADQHGSQLLDAAAGSVAMIEEFGIPLVEWHGWMVSPGKVDPTHLGDHA